MKSQSFFDPGELSHRLVLESLTETSDNCGGVQLIWNSVGGVWARLRPMRDRVDLVAQQSDETLTHEITIRYRSDVASGWRFKKGDRIFEIVTVWDPDERQRYLICSSREEGR